MKKFFRGFRKASDLREREGNAKLKAALLRKLSDFIDGRGGGEHEVVNAMRAWRKDMTEEEVQNYIKRLRTAASDAKERDQEPC
jgi:hypothetical protein